MADLMLAFSANPAMPPDIHARYTHAVIEFATRHWGQPIGQMQVGRVLLDLMGILRAFGMRLHAGFTTVNIAIAMTEGLGKQLDPTLDLMQEALPYFLSRATTQQQKPQTPQ
jgi:predicted unusual protein kinase regulating ubiquinone biosynthesis (AarF/ABC1/UbiB family)